MFGELVPSSAGALAGALASGQQRSKDPGEEAGPRGSLCTRGWGGCLSDCLQLMATQMAFMALIYGALIVVELG